MSGSPIIQNGKLIGVVTYVLVDDPTKGYAIFAEYMLETAQSVAKEQQLKDASRNFRYTLAVFAMYNTLDMPLWQRKIYNCIVGEPLTWAPVVFLQKSKKYFFLTKGKK